MTIAARRERPANPRDTSQAVSTSENASAEMPERDIVKTSDIAINTAAAASRISRFASGDDSHRMR